MVQLQLAKKLLSTLSLSSPVSLSDVLQIEETSSLITDNSSHGSLHPALMNAVPSSTSSASTNSMLQLQMPATASSSTSTSRTRASAAESSDLLLLPVPAAAVGAVIGSGGAAIKDLETQCKCLCVLVDVWDSHLGELEVRELATNPALGG